MEKKRQRWQAFAMMVTLLAWVTFIVLFALLWAPDLSLFQNIVISIASFVVAVTVGAGAYAVWAEKRRERGQAAVTMVTLLVWVIFIALFALLWAPSLDLFQNIVILFASFVAAVTLGAGTFAMRYGWESSRSKED